ncbi:MAG: SpoIIE family protein phosphatase, partial [Dehalococcoidia bacterium]
EAPRSRPLVMVVDDNADMRAHLMRVLSPHWSTTAAADGQTALEMLQRDRPDLLVSDVMMPALDGIGLLAAIRADPELSAMPVVLLSARAGIEAASEALGAGADEYLVKPFASRELIARVTAKLDAAGRQRSAREEAGLRHEHAQAVAELATALNDAGSVQEVLETLLARQPASLASSAVAVALRDAEQESVRIFYAGAVDPQLPDRYHTVALDAPVPLAEVAYEGTPMTISDTSELTERYRTVAADWSGSVRAACLHPLRDGQDTFGAVGLMWSEPRDFSTEEAELMEQSADAVARSLRRIQLVEREHRIAVEMQTRLLEVGRSSSAAALSAVYHPCSETMRVGGDWYTALSLSREKIAVSVGDVVGSGLPAAAVMGQLRSALNTAAIAAEHPAEVAEIVTRFAANVDGAACATVTYAVIDNELGTIDYIRAGHPYPLLLTADGEVRRLTGGGRVPLGVRGQQDPTIAGREPMPVGSLLVMYTDGLLERRGESLDAGLDRLSDAITGCSGLAVGAVCKKLLNDMEPDNGFTDDVAIIAVRRPGRTATSYVATLPSELAEVPAARKALRSWLQARELSHAAVHDIVLATGEALNNAIAHGNDHVAEQIVSIEAFADAESVSVSVSDSGRWLKDSSASRRAGAGGRGLALMHGLSEQVLIDRTPLGTRVTMRFSAARVGDPAGA